MYDVVTPPYVEVGVVGLGLLGGAGDDDEGLGGRDEDDGDK